MLQTSASAKAVTTEQHSALNGAAAAPPAARATLNIAVVIVTWNRAAEVDAALRAVARQDIDPRRLDVIIVDNASTDGTTDRLRESWRPERIYDNLTGEAHEPAFSLVHDSVAGDGAADPGAGASRNAAGFASLTIIRNRENLGGCGGFNTGLCAVDQLLDLPDRPRRPDYIWLVDDDIDLPADACRRLVEAAEADPGVGIVGSRAVDFHDRTSTFETTIYFDFDRGRMGDTPTPRHRLRPSHEAWLKKVGAPRGRGAYSGVVEVDVVSACSMLARWSAVREVGFWDKRYFIYCDDADWCLRFGRAGWRVALCLDAVVYHTPWFHKLTPARLYYSQRNIVWTLQKALSGPRLRYATFRWMASIMYDALQAAFRRRTFHADIIRRTADDIASGRGGRFDDTGPPKIPVAEALRQAGALAPGARIAVICPRPEFVRWAEDLRRGTGFQPVGGRTAPEQPDASDGSAPPASTGAASSSTSPAPPTGRDARATGPEWIYLIRNDAIAGADSANRSRSEGEPLPPRSGDTPGGGPPSHIIYSRRLRSKLLRQLPLLRRPPDVVIVFNQTSDFPLLRGRRNCHIDQRTPDLAQIEPDGAGARLAFLARWTLTGLRVAWFLATLRRYRSRDRFG